jgi:hypothetical protein
MMGRRIVLMLGGAWLLTAALFSVRGTAGESVGGPTPQQVFERRILPIFRSPNPSSCTQCHLAGVDLKNYILPSDEKTFLSLRDQGLIDLDRPERSHILHLIQMGADDRQGAALIRQKVRRAEYDAFAEWIKACCRDPKLRDAPPLPVTERAQPARPPEVIRHARKDHLLASFERNVWAMRFRCMSCHIEGTPENDKLRKEHGDRVAWVKAAGAEATMNYLLASRLINKDEPEKSLRLLKPLGAVKHGGGKKFLPGDLGYKAFRAWLDDYARTVKDGYETAADLPSEKGQPARFGTDVWLKIADTPPAWGDHLLQVTLYAWDADRNAWETGPIAVSDRGVWGGGKLWQHNLTLLAAPGSERARQWQRGRPVLPPGRYRVKVHVDRRDRLAHDWQAALGEADYVGAAEVTSRWPAGYGSMTVLEAGQVRR